MSAEDPAQQPVLIDLDRTRELRIRWSDGLESVYPLSLLRRECPCASCREGRSERERTPLRVVPSANEQHDMVIADKAELVGHYALRITWKDGHDAGIYDFALLRALAPSRTDAGRQSRPVRG